VFASSSILALYPSFKDHLKMRVPAAFVLSSLSAIHPFIHTSYNFNLLRLWLVTEVTVDAGITSALLWEFRRAGGILTDTKGCAIWQILYQLHGSGIISKLDRLTAVTIQSGAAAATLAGAALIS
jgi:hypothetical protein